VLICDRALPEADPSSLPPFTSVANASDAPVRWIYYTSGTTADPKGVMHTDASVRASADGLIDSLRVTDDDVSAMVFPYAHIGGLTLTFAGFMAGMKHVFVEAFAPETAIPVLQREGLTIAGAGTVFHMAYLDAQRRLPDGEVLFPRVRAFPGGGAPKPPQLHYDVKAAFDGVGIKSAYGSTEFPNATSNRLTDEDEQLAHTEGPTNRGVELQIVTLDERIADTGEEGEIRVKGPQMFRGYVDGALDTEAFDADGWFRTGDLGLLNDHGSLVITGRLKDVIIRKGENISAKEVEDLLFTHPAVADVAVIGLPDAALGERCCAVVVPTDPAGPPALPELFDFLVGAGVSRQKIPEQLEIVDALPRNPSGKVLKRELRRMYSG
jgi:acyl-CoA synthetase (AMP-forming)/AMP-acid ligase II